MEPHRQPATIRKRKWNATKTAVLLSVLSMGLGQWYNRQWIKGSLFLILQFSYVVVFYDIFNMGLWGIVTLGEKPFRDNSILLMAEGLIAIFLILFGLLFYGLNIRDAYQVGRLREQGLRSPGIWASFRAVTDKGFPYLILFPSFLFLVFVVIYPLLFMMLIAFTNYDLYHSPPAKLVDWVGVDNFTALFQLDLWRNSFVNVFSWTVVWTLVATTVQFALGLILAVLINQKRVRGKRFFRTVLILPWAVPPFITIITWAALFNDDFGFINQMLSTLGIGAIPWLTDAFWTKAALLLIQFWLGFPFNMALCTGVLQSISSEMYEAAEVDGASAFDQFRSITLPMVLYATAPLLIVQYAGNFNNFNVIYLFNQGGPAVPESTAGGSDILISWVYKLMFDISKFNYAAAISIIIAIIVMSLAAYQFTRTRSFKEEDMIQ
ncbi:carbohydrate ABC transporter permease [Desmospora profundinema]|uniref:Maltose/maltodextrin transport system permease protein n=1 Tax=Desmospora profundinema TaxID=1571184 RepID=A0ABU1ILD2_9BACL|nr:sugar ABC transporter permease [Desmospora profundinema]MDR6224964.1 arabinogalactan oligomer/maltooligosaccharide transport system permease protein [Desmospora profundinema]